MKINVGIVGYGNLGKALETEILKDSHYNLIAIFSRRVIKSKFNTPVEPYENYIAYKGKIDIMFLCGGSLLDLEFQTQEIVKHFDCLNTFDTHSKIKNEYKKLDLIAKKHNHRVILSCGWDPGVFSIVRTLFYSITKQEPVCFWGKGISMGHSDAIRRIDGVDDGIQFTIPNKKAITLAKKGIADANVPKHFRECFIVSNDTFSHPKIEKSIKNIPNYFKHQPTNVSFITSEKLLKLKTKMFHKGEVLGFSNNEKLSFNVKMKSNPIFTAKILVAYAKAVIKLKKEKICGAFTPMHIPISMLIDKENFLFSMC